MCPTELTIDVLRSAAAAACSGPGLAASPMRGPPNIDDQNEASLVDQDSLASSVGGCAWPHGWHRTSRQSRVRGRPRSGTLLARRHRFPREATRRLRDEACS